MSTVPIRVVGTIAITVKTSRNPLRRPARSLMAPSTGETIALTRTDTETATVNQN
jgi:hypothetical protein